MSRVQKDRVHSHRQAVVDPLGGADQLELEPEVARVLEVVGLDVLDPLVAHLVEVHRGVERQPRDDRHLRRRVAPVDVLGRVGLGVPEPLGLGQRLLVGHARPGHLGEDEVRRAVDDPVDAVDRGPRQRLLQHPDHRHDAGHRALEAQLHSLAAGGLPQLLAVLGQELLVGRDHVAAAAHRAQQVVPGRVDPADQLDDQVRVLQQLVERAPAARHHARQLGTQAGDPRDPVRMRGQRLGKRAAHGAVAQQPDPERPLSRRHARPGPRRSRGGPRRARSPRRRRSPGLWGRRCSYWPSRTRRRR